MTIPIIGMTMAMKLLKGLLHNTSSLLLALYEIPES